MDWLLCLCWFWGSVSTKWRPLSRKQNHFQPSAVFSFAALSLSSPKHNTHLDHSPSNICLLTCFLKFMLYKRSSVHILNDPCWAPSNADCPEPVHFTCHSWVQDLPDQLKSPTVCFPLSTHISLWAIWSLHASGSMWMCYQLSTAQAQQVKLWKHLLHWWLKLSYVPPELSHLGRWTKHHLILRWEISN